MGWIEPPEKEAKTLPASYVLQIPERKPEQLRGRNKRDTCVYPKFPANQYETRVGPNM